MLGAGRGAGIALKSTRAIALGPQVVTAASGSTSSRCAIVPRRSLATSTTCSAADTSSRAGKLKDFRDEAIRARVVRLVDPESGSLMPAVYQTRELLATIDRKRFWVVQVKPQTMSRKPAEKQDQAPAQSQRVSGTNRGKDDGEDEAERDSATMPTLEEMAIVKLVDKKVAYDKQRTAKRGSSADASDASGTSSGQQSVKGAGVSGAAAFKEVHLTWASTSYDMEHKLQSIKTTHLIRRGPGAQLSITITTPPNKGKVRPMQSTTPEAKKAFCESIEQFVCDWKMTAEDFKIQEDGRETGGEAQKGKQDDTSGTTKGKGYHARRRGEVEWRGGKRLATAIIRFDVVRL